LARMYQGRWVIPMRRSNASKPQLKIKFQVSATVDEITPTMNDEMESLPSNARITAVNPTASTSNITEYEMRRPSGDGKMRRPTRASRSLGPTGTFGILTVDSCSVVTPVRISNSLIRGRHTHCQQNIRHRRSVQRCNN